MPEKDGSTFVTINVNATPDPTKEVSHHELARLKTFAVGVPHKLEVLLVTNASGGGALVALVDGKLVVNHSGPVGIGSRQFYSKDGWYDGGDDQVRAMSVWCFTISAVP